MAREEAFVDLNLVAVGKFRADQRVAYLLLAFFQRMQALGLGEGTSCELPLKQHHIADALGLSLPYANSALRRLIKDQLLLLRSNRLCILDFERFCERAIAAPQQRAAVAFI